MLGEAGDVEAYLRAVKAIAMTTARTLTDQCSAFWYTFTKQYINAANQRNHSRNAATITEPTIAVYAIYHNLVSKVCPVDVEIEKITSLAGQGEVSYFMLG